MSAPIAVVATLSAVTMGVLGAQPVTTDSSDNLLAAGAVSTSSGNTQSFANATALARRGEVTVSRSQIRTAAKAESAARQDMEVDKLARRAAKKLDDRMWTTAPLNLWDSPGKNAEKLGVVAALRQVSVTGRHQMGRAQVVIDGRSRWVTRAYLAQHKPKPELAAKAVSAGPSLGGTCSNGSTISAGHAALYAIHDVVCANWPQITSYGTWRGDGEHAQGRAIDIMVSGSTGWEVAEFLRANYSALGIEYIIHAQKIWSVERSGEGWRSMADRGSITANHYDHVHVTVY